MDPKYCDIGNIDDHVIEECSEVIKAIIKSKRFGLFKHHPNKPNINNKQKILDEINDLEIVLEKYKQYLYDQKENINKSCEHCWHTNTILISNPPQYKQICCHCGKERIIKQFINAESNHGKFLGKLND